MNDPLTSVTSVNPSKIIGQQGEDLDMETDEEK
jgi:hypothetical protein